MRSLENYNYIFKNKELIECYVVDQVLVPKSDPVSHKQVMDIYILRTEILDLKCLLLNEYLESDQSGLK
jgi:hypothetical protein